MRYYKLLAFLVIPTIIEAAQSFQFPKVIPNPTLEDITSTTYIINNPDLPKGASYKHLENFKQFIAERRKIESRVNDIIASSFKIPHVLLSFSEYNFSTLEENEEHALEFVQRFFITHTLISLINMLFDTRYQNCGQEGFCCSNNSDKIISQIDDHYSIQLFLFFNRIQKGIAHYQQKRDKNFFSTLLDPSFFTTLLDFNGKALNPYVILLFARSCNGLRSMYRALINDIIIHLSLIPESHYEKFPFLKFFQQQEAVVLNYYKSFPSDRELIQDFKSPVCGDHKESDCNAEHFFGKDNYIRLDSICRPLIVNVPEDLKKIYLTLYNKVTNKGRIPLKITLHDFWAGKLEIPVTSTISGIIEKPQRPPAEQGMRAIQKEVKAILKDLGLEQESTPKTSTKSSKKKHYHGAPKAVAEAADVAQDVPEEDDEPSLIYNFNRELSQKKIEVDQRIADWYILEEGQPRALKKQGYLQAGTDRYALLHKTIQEKRTKQHALAHITFLHQLPYSLIKNIINYGTIIPGSTAAHTTIIGLIGIKKDDTFTYYQAEIAGEIKRKTFNIWHAFLRPLKNPSEIINDIVNLDPKDFEKIIAETSSDHADSKFTLPAEDKGWIINDQPTYVSIIKDKIEYVLFKN